MTDKPAPLTPEILHGIARTAPLLVSTDQVVSVVDQLLRAEAYWRERAERLAGVLRILFYRHPGNPLLFYRHPGNPPLTKAEYDTIRTVLAEEPKA